MYEKPLGSKWKLDSQPQELSQATCDEGGTLRCLRVADPSRQGHEPLHWECWAPAGPTPSLFCVLGVSQVLNCLINEWG